MKHQFDVFPKASRQQCINKVHYLIRFHGLSEIDAIKRVLCFRKKHGNDHYLTAMKKERMQHMRKTVPELAGKSYAEIEPEYQKKINTKKTQKYYESNREYQRLSGRIHYAKVTGKIELMNKLLQERNTYKKTAA